jgi:hypothetical protein
MSAHSIVHELIKGYRQLAVVHPAVVSEFDLDTGKNSMCAEA